MPQDVSDAPNLPPRDLGSGIGDVIRNGMAGLGNDLHGALNHPPQLPTRLEILKRFALRNFFYPGNRFQNILENVIKLSRHQNTRIAERSMSALSMG